jgi:hypothetical protein
MDMILGMLKFLFLFIAVLFTLINTVKWSRGSAITAGNFLFQAVGIAGFIYLQWC